MRFGYPLTDRQPETGAPGATRPPRVDAVKAIEDAGQMLGRDARTGVADPHDGPTVLTDEVDRDRSAGLGIADRVVDQVQRELLEPVRIAFDLDLLELAEGHLHVVGESQRLFVYVEEERI